MNIVVLAPRESLFLPSFFPPFLKKRGRDVRAIFMTPLHYGKETSLDSLWRFQTAFGWWNLGRIAWRIITAKILDRLGIGPARGRYYSIPSIAKAHGIPCQPIADVNTEDFLQRLRDLQTDLIVSIYCTQLFGSKLIELPRKGCLNIHGAPLPRYRGIAPAFWMMTHGEPKAAETVFLVNQFIDAGDIVEVEHFDIQPYESLYTFILRSKRIAGECLLRAIDKVENGTAQPVPLNKEEGSYFSFPTREAYHRFRQRGRRLW